MAEHDFYRRRTTGQLSLAATLLKGTSSAAAIDDRSRDGTADEYAREALRIRRIYLGAPGTRIAR
ncbi:MAG: hypothetical protein ACYS74_03800 [Planctomycetota bacterium]